MTDLLQQAHDLDQRARAAGLPGILPEGMFLELDAMKGWVLHEGSVRFSICIPETVAVPAVREWLRQWCVDNWRTIRGWNRNAGGTYETELIGKTTAIIEHTESCQHAGETGESK